MDTSTITILRKHLREITLWSTDSENWMKSSTPLTSYNFMPPYRNNCPWLPTLWCTNTYKPRQDQTKLITLQCHSGVTRQD
jgi:hypothetical protein